MFLLLLVGGRRDCHRQADADLVELDAPPRLAERWGVRTAGARPLAESRGYDEFIFEVPI
jgi:hypothetical protein